MLTSRVNNHPDTSIGTSFCGCPPNQWEWFHLFRKMRNDSWPSTALSFRCVLTKFLHGGCKSLRKLAKRLLIFVGTLG